MAKAPTGIAGLDEALKGGLPRGRTTLIFGGPGCGKTVLSLQTLVNAASRWNEPGIFVAFEENSRQVIANATTFGWNLGELQTDKLFFLDATLRPDVVRAGKFDLNGILAALSVKVKAFGAKRLVFDGIDVLLTLLDDPAAERAELHRRGSYIPSAAILASRAQLAKARCSASVFRWRGVTMSSPSNLCSYHPHPEEGASWSWRTILRS